MEDEEEEPPLLLMAFEMYGIICAYDKGSENIAVTI
jgi:hypothetical protein